MDRKIMNLTRTLLTQTIFLKLQILNLFTVTMNTDYGKEKTLKKFLQTVMLYLQSEILLPKARNNFV